MPNCPMCGFPPHQPDDLCDYAGGAEAQPSTPEPIEEPVQAEENDYYQASLFDAAAEEPVGESVDAVRAEQPVELSGRSTVEPLFEQHAKRVEPPVEGVPDDVAEAWRRLLHMEPGPSPSETLPMRRRIADSINDHQHWVILNMGDASEALVLDLYQDGLPIEQVRLPKPLAFDLALVAKSDLAPARLAEKIRAIWGSQLELTDDSEEDIVAMPDRTTEDDQHAEFYSLAADMVVRILQHWVETGVLNGLVPTVRFGLAPA